MVDAQGITVIGPGRTKTLYKWDALYGVGIAAYGASASRQRYQKVLFPHAAGAGHTGQDL